MKYHAWEKLAPKYNTQWVQKYSLGPTRREVKSIVLPLLAQNPDIKILDVGCGTGQLIGEISQTYAAVDYLGIDVTPEMIEIAQADNPGDRIRFLNVSVDDFACDEQFDIILCTHAFPYFPNKKQAMQKMHALCKQGGMVIIVSSSTNNLKDLLANLIVKTQTSKAQYPSVAQMTRMFGNAGFRVTRTSVIRERAYMPTIALMCAERS